MRDRVTGRVATRRIVAEQGATRTWIAATTANATIDDHAACRAAGMDDFVTKPLSLASVTAAIDRARGVRREVA